MGQDQFGIAKGEGGGTRNGGGRAFGGTVNYGLGKRQKGVNEDIETGNDLVGGLKAEPPNLPPIGYFQALDSPLRLDRLSKVGHSGLQCKLCICPSYQMTNEKSKSNVKCCSETFLIDYQIENKL